jgi:hypothetical protein
MKSSPTTNMAAYSGLKAKPQTLPVDTCAPRGFTLLALGMSALIAGCSTYPTPQPAYRTSSQHYSQQNPQQNLQAYPQHNRQPYQQPAAQSRYADNGWVDNGYAENAYPPVVSVYVEPPISQPEPVFVGWAPPPMLVETSVASPYASAVWVGGYWVWSGNWVWAAGHWMAPPRPDYGWVQPYYEHRERGVIFITGHWAAPGTMFAPPAPNLQLTLVRAAPGVLAGPAPIGPMGVFVPPPPGSRIGLIVPAPIGTSPAVVTSAAPVINVGMRIQNNTSVYNSRNSNTSNTSNANNTSNVTNVTNISNVTIIAPAGATANGLAFQSSVPAQASLAAALPPVVRVAAPVPRSTRAIPSFAAGQALPQLPAAQAMPTLPTLPLPAQPMQRRDARSPLPASAASAASAASTPMPAAPSAPISRPTFDAQTRAERTPRTSALTSQSNVQLNSQQNFQSNSQPILQPSFAPQSQPMPAPRAQPMPRPTLEPMPTALAERPNPGLNYQRQPAPRASPEAQPTAALASARPVAPAPMPQTPAMMHQAPTARPTMANPNPHSARAARSAREEEAQKARRADGRE